MSKERHGNFEKKKAPYTSSSIRSFVFKNNQYRRISLGLPDILEDLLRLIKKKLSRPNSPVSVRLLTVTVLNSRYSIAYNSAGRRIRMH